ncbi:MAG: hypothetical protein AAF483_05000 [Planctomycetota bacterium]
MPALVTKERAWSFSKRVWPQFFPDFGRLPRKDAGALSGQVSIKLETLIRPAILAVVFENLEDLL